ncbi:hypothetical protein MD484_g6107, partial [Candolleomyces efflorescens]
MSVISNLDPTEEEILAVEALVLPIADENESEPDLQVAQDVIPVDQSSILPQHATSGSSTPGQSPATPRRNAPESGPTVTGTPQLSNNSSGTVSFPSAAAATTPVRNGLKDMVGYVKHKETQTPSKPSSDLVHDSGSADQIGKLLKEELGENIPEVDTAWVADIYRHMASDSEIYDYLETCGLYENQRWVELPEAAGTELVLYDPFCNIINSILEHFDLSGPNNDARKAIDTHLIRLKHGAPNSETTHFSSPDISVKGSGPSFIRAAGDQEVGFSNMATFFDAKRDSEVNKEAKHIVQFGLYSRQLFIHQPNRRYVRSMALTERRARVYHFDRSGAQYTQLFDIHAEAYLFVRLVLGLCTTEERLLGLDDTVQWTVGANGIRTGGTLTTIGANNNPVVYRLSTSEKPWNRSSLRGRGTVCWPVKSRNGEMLIVKDYWMTEGRTPEYELLELLKGIPGICQLVAYEGWREQTKDFRGDTHDFPKHAFHNCIAIRLVLRAYGTSIDNFTSPEEMLAALRDVIAAHRIVVSKGLFHRDICHNNVLIGMHGIQAKIGERGMLMDFDMAIGPLTGKGASDISEGFKSGILMFQSANIAKAISDLTSTSKKPKKKSKRLGPTPNLKFPTHDHFDELESFFWLFCYLIFTHNPNGGKGPETPFQQYLEAMMTAGTAAGAKDQVFQSFYIPGEAKESLYPGWHDVGCLDLFIEWRKIMGTRFSNKAVLYHQQSAPLADGALPVNRFAQAIDADDVNNVYERILSLIDATLVKALERAAPPLRRSLRLIKRARSLDGIRLSAIPQASGSGSNKRAAGELEDVEDHPKRQKRPCTGPSRLSQTIEEDTDSSDDDDI